MNFSNQSIYCYNTFFELYSRQKYYLLLLFLLYCSIENGTKKEIEFTKVKKHSSQ